jgi:hypothetical protein
MRADKKYFGRKENEVTSKGENYVVRSCVKWGTVALRTQQMHRHFCFGTQLAM